MIKQLNRYLKKQWRLIPIVKNDKKPLIDWKQYQYKSPSLKEYKQWFETNRNVAVITGKASNITIIDIDNEEMLDIIKKFILSSDFKKIGIVKTPRKGFHLYFSYTSELSTTTNPNLKIDIRNDGGYALLPPSKINDNPYVWQNFPYKLIPIPAELLNYLKSPQRIFFTEQNLQLGGRDEGLFHLAYYLVKGGMSFDEIFNVLRPYAKICKPPFPDKELKIKIESAFKRAGDKSISLAEEVRLYVDNVSGMFSTRDIFRDLNIYTLQDKKNVSKILKELTDKGILTKAGKWNATYRKKETDIVPIDLKKLKIGKILDLKFPFQLEQMFEIYPKNIIVIAGVQNVGKTLFALHFAKLNQDKFKIHYFNSEMSEEELALRLKQFRIKWKINVYCRTTNFQDVIFPDDINIIDYLEVEDEFWKIGKIINDIHEKLNKGICVIGIQKDSAKLLGRGASFGLEKPRVYLSMDRDKLIIVKAKNWKTKENPNFKCLNFRIKGINFVTDGQWFEYREPINFNGKKIK